MKHPPWSTVLAILLTVAPCRSQMEKALTIGESTAVIIGLQRYFRSGCVFFLYSNVREDYGELTI
jgi:hypothetical protein